MLYGGGELGLGRDYWVFGEGVGDIQGVIVVERQLIEWR